MTLENDVDMQTVAKWKELIDECNRLQQVIDDLNTEVDKLNRKIKFLEDKQNET